MIHKPLFFFLARCQLQFKRSNWPNSFSSLGKMEQSYNLINNSVYRRLQRGFPNILYPTWTKLGSRDSTMVQLQGQVLNGLQLEPQTSWNYTGIVASTQEQLRLSRTSWGYPGLVGTTQDQLGLPWTSWDYPGLVASTQEQLRLPRTSCGTNLDQLGLPWTSWDYPGLVGNTQDQLGLPWTSQDFPGLVGTPQDQLGLPWTSWDYPGLVGTPQDQQGLPWTSWDYPGLVGTPQDQLGLPWTSWDYTGLVGTPQNQQGLPWTSWDYPGLVGTTQDQASSSNYTDQDFRIKFKLSDLNPVCFSFCVFVLSENQCNQTIQRSSFTFFQICIHTQFKILINFCYKTET